jgi:hypothetical protein
VAVSQSMLLAYILDTCKSYESNKKHIDRVRSAECRFRGRGREARARRLRESERSHTHSHTERRGDGGTRADTRHARERPPGAAPPRGDGASAGGANGRRTDTDMVYANARILNSIRSTPPHLKSSR